MITLPPDFKEFIQFVNSRKVEYLLIGGYAVALYGYVRYTSDIDIWIGADEENALKMIEVLDDFGVPNARGFLPIFIDKGRVFSMGSPPFKIEVINAIDGVEFTDCFTRRVEFDMNGLPVQVICLEDLRMNKLASGRYKDLNDLEHLFP
jgi:predicted nucleotidyltransferase